MTEVAIKPIEDVRRNLNLMESQFSSVLPKQIPPEKFIRVVMTAIQDNPDLLLCDRRSLYSACMKCAQDGLLPDKREAALVQFKDQVVYMPMVGGILKKVRNSGELVSITAHCVFQKDYFKFGTDSTRGGDFLEHSPEIFGEKGDLLGCYALAITNNGGMYIEVLSKEQIEKIRECSRAKKGGPWFDWYEEMAQKSAIRRLSKRLPVSTDLQEFLRADDQLYDVTPNESQKAEKVKSSRLTQIVQAREGVTPGPSQEKVEAEANNRQESPQPTKEELI